MIRQLFLTSVFALPFLSSGPSMAQPYTYGEYLRQGGCVDQSGNVRRSTGSCDPQNSKAAYSQHYNHLKSVGCIDSYGYVTRSLFCLNTEPTR